MTQPRKGLRMKYKWLSIYATPNGVENVCFPLPRVERCAFNPGLCDDTHSVGIQNGDARISRLYKTYCYSIIYLCESVYICGSFDAPVRGFKRIRLFHRGQRHTEPAVIVAFAGVVAEPKR